MKRRFRMTITPTKDGESFEDIKRWVYIHWGVDFWNGDLLFGTRQKYGYIAMLEQAKQS